MLDLIRTLLGIYILIVILRIILGMVAEFGRIPWGHPVRRITDILGLAVDPLLRPLRRVLPPVRLGSMALDLSPMVLIAGLVILQNIIS